MCMLTRRLQVLLDPDRAQRLDAEAARRKVPAAVIVREGLDAVLPGAASVDKHRVLDDLLSGHPIAVPDDPRTLRAESDRAHARGDQ